MSLKDRAAKLKIQIPAIFIALKKKDTPFAAKVLAALTVCYALSPIDLIPDFIPVLGYLDDILLLPLMAAVTIRLIPRDIWEQSLMESEGLWQDGKPQKWLCAAPVIAVWAVIIYFLISML